MIRRRLRLRRADGAVYLDRWGLGTRLCGVYLHRMTAPDPGLDLHDHPWWFCSLILRGGYTEACAEARRELSDGGHGFRTWRRGSVHSLGLDVCHRIIDIEKPTWTLIFRGPVRRTWGFYTPEGWVRHTEHNAERRDLVADRSI